MSVGVARHHAVIHVPVAITGNLAGWFGSRLHGVINAVAIPPLPPAPSPIIFGPAPITGGGPSGTGGSSSTGTASGVNTALRHRRPVVGCIATPVVIVASLATS